MAARLGAELCLDLARVSRPQIFGYWDLLRKLSFTKKIVRDRQKLATNFADQGCGHTRAGPHPGQRV